MPAGATTQSKESGLCNPPNGRRGDGRLALDHLAAGLAHHSRQLHLPSLHAGGLNMTQRWRLAALVLVSCALVVGTAGAEVHRLLSAELDGASIGSTQHSATGYLTLPVPGAKTLRGVMVLSAAEKKPEALSDYIARRSGLEAIVVSIPQQLDAESSANLRDIEQALLGATVSVPVFFTRDTPELQAAVAGTSALLARGSPPSTTSDRWEVVLQGLAAPVERGPQPYNYWAMLAGAQPASGSERLPTLLLTAHYDAFCAAPTAPCGSDSNGSGVAGLLALLRALHLLYQDPATQPATNVLFLLTSGGALGHEGLRQWLGDAEPAVLESITFALSLDSIAGSSSSSRGVGAGAPLYLHSVAGQEGGAWAQAFANASSILGTPLEAVPSPPAGPSRSGASVAAVAAAWAHEHLAKKGIPSATLSAQPQAPALGVSSSSSADGQLETPQQVALSSIRVASLADAPSAVVVDQVLGATQLAAAALQQLLYPDLPSGLKLLDISGAKGVNGPLVTSWLHLLATTPRVHPLDHVTAGGKAMHQSLMRYLREHSNSFKRHMWQPSVNAAGSSLTPLTVLDAGSGTLSVYFAAGSFLDMVLLAATVVYLGGLWLAIRVVTSSWDEVRPAWEARSRGKGSKGR